MDKTLPPAERRRIPRFTAADIDRMVRALRSTDCDYPRVAAQFGVSQAYVEKIASLRRREIGIVRAATDGGTPRRARKRPKGDGNDGGLPFPSQA